MSWSTAPGPGGPRSLTCPRTSGVGITLPERRPSGAVRGVVAWPGAGPVAAPGRLLSSVRCGCRGFSVRAGVRPRPAGAFQPRLLLPGRPRRNAAGGRAEAARSLPRAYPSELPPPHPPPLRRRSRPAAAPAALASPESTGDLAERFTEDPHELVRARAAADPRLSPATVLQLLDSTHRIREAAIKTRSSRSPTSSAYSAPQPPHRPRPATRRSPQRSSTGWSIWPASQNGQNPGESPRDFGSHRGARIVTGFHPEPGERGDGGDERRGVTGRS